MKSLIRWFLGMCCFCTVFSCSSISDSKRHQVEALNHRAFNLRYSYLDSIEIYARKALSLSEGYSQGKAESYNNLALAAYMRQDFVEAEKYYHMAKQATDNQIELLLSDIGMLKVCSRASANKRFYDYEAAVQNRIRRIHNESDVLDEHDLTRLAFAESDFHLSAAIYYYYLQHDQKAKEELLAIDAAALANADSIQWAYYEYMMASVSLLGGATFEEEVRLEFDALLRLLFYARQKELIYIEANVLETFVDKLTDSQWFEVADKSRGSDFIYLNSAQVSDTLLAESLSKEALARFKAYGDYYQISGARRRLSDIYFQKGDYEACYEELQKALKDINTHFDIYNKYTGYTKHLEAFVPGDTTEVDVEWMEHSNISTVPQWLVNIRQSLSMVYAALGNKEASDYNRNIYLDLLDKTRQDKEQEARLEQLEKETQNLNIWFWALSVLTVVGGVLLILLNRKWRRNNTERIHRLNQVAELCNYITSSVPTGVEDKEELLEKMRMAFLPRLKALFGQEVIIAHEEVSDHLSLQTNTLLNKDDKNLLALLEPYLNWAYQYGANLVNLDEVFKQLEKERYLHEQHIAEKKRKNLEKRTCMSIVTGITPFLDRALNEINRLSRSKVTEEEKHKRFSYIQELIDRINEFNDIMALWIKMKQGALSLQIESFSLADLFATIAKSKHAYESKSLNLQVDDTTACVKADKPLTLFMINTLCENARKYTPTGGTVHVYAQEQENYVEISVQDTGIGLSEKDRKLILEEKVYDSSKIGMLENAPVDLLKNKGYGFGLMNCKGIIDKYRKTNALFSVCLFNIESTPGKGSRFYFRLPKGILRLFLVLVFLIPSLYSQAQNEVDSYLLKASAWADSTYYANIDGLYEEALEYADSTCYYMNRYYRKHYPKSNLQMSLVGPQSMAELEWYERGVVTDYHIILDVRNEAAVAALALGKWDIYRVNNEAYTKLYRLLGEDKTLDGFCHQMQNTANNRIVSVVLLVVLMLTFIITVYGLYFRQALLYRINVHQVLGINQKLLDIFQLHEETEDFEKLPEQMLHRIYADLNTIHPIDGLAIKIKDAEGHLLDTKATSRQLLSPALEESLRQTIQEKQRRYCREHEAYIYPLVVKHGQEDTCIGAFAFIQTAGTADKNETILRNLIIRYLSVVMYQTLIRLNLKHNQLEQAEDDKRKAIHEENLLHVQNMVLDNCLSTLKHETMYYPNRIRLIVEKLQGEQNLQTEAEQVSVMSELIHYYKDIFTTLSECANRQIENMKFSRKKIPVANITKHLEKYFNKVVRKNQLDWELVIRQNEAFVLGDEHLLCFLMENLIEACVEKQNAEKATFLFYTQQEDGFIRMTLEDPRGHYTQEELNLLFYPDQKRMKVDESGRLHGTQYLNMRQIIRDHDELCRHRGCRINAETLGDKGMKIWFTIPAGNYK